MLPLLVPVDSRIVHFVDEDDHVLDSGGLNQHGVLAGLASALEASLKFSFSGRNYL
jgi:hypothetical protein